MRVARSGHGGRRESESAREKERERETKGACMKTSAQRST